MWEIIIGVAVVAAVAAFAYHYPSLFKKTVDAGTDAAKDAVEKIKENTK